MGPPGTKITFDKGPLPESCVQTLPECTPSPDSVPYAVWKCQLSFPKILEGLPPPDNVDPNNQNDGYHILEADHPIELIVYGFDKHVSYAYMGGTDVHRINVK